MGAQENKQAAEDAYRAFDQGDVEGAMRNIDESVVWTVRGDKLIAFDQLGDPTIANRVFAK